MTATNSMQFQENTEDLSRRGQSYFKNVQISWMFSEEFGLTIAHMRCGICLMPLESVALRVGDEIHLLCEEGHLIGSDIEPSQARKNWTVLQQKYTNEVAERKHRFADEYQALVAEVLAGRKTESELKEWENNVPSFHNLPGFVSHREYNKKLEELSKLFTEAHFETG
jgi:hypothetical protein